jgi:hypothetical protein
MTGKEGGTHNYLSALNGEIICLYKSVIHEIFDTDFD